MEEHISLTWASNLGETVPQSQVCAEQALAFGDAPPVVEHESQAAQLRLFKIPLLAHLTVCYFRPHILSGAGAVNVASYVH